MIAAIPSNADPTGAIGQDMLAWTRYGRLNLHAALTGPCTDNDGDGFCVERYDCNDSDASINPGVSEVCDDLIDNDCDGFADSNDDECSSPPICSIIQIRKTCNAETACSWDNRYKTCVEN